MITIAGNPVLSAPDGDRLDRALDGVGFMVSIDPYLNETTRHADVILPPPPPVAERPLRLRAQQPRGAQQRPVFAAGAAAPTADPTRRRSCRGSRSFCSVPAPTAIPLLVDEQVIATTLAKETADPTSPVAGRPVAELTAMLAPGPGYERRLDMMLRLGAYGDAFGAKPEGLTLQRLKDDPARCRPGPAAAAPVRGTADANGENRTRAAAAHRGRGEASGGPRPARRSIRAHRTTASAFQQQLDAQRARTRRRQ